MTDNQRRAAEALGWIANIDLDRLASNHRREVQHVTAALDAAEARGRAEVMAKVEALAAEYASMAATLHDVRAADAFASVEIDLRALIVRESA